MKIAKFVLSRLRGGAWGELPPLLPKATVHRFPPRADKVFPHRRAA